MNCDALMRWEWEGGTRASVDRLDEAVRTNPAEPTQIQSQPITGRRPAGGAASFGSAKFQGRRGDGGNG
jgi:hypothetical protein